MPARGGVHSPLPRGAAIATPHHEATRAGEAVLRQGGTAVDAAITAATVLTVVYPHNVSIGGDLIALVRTPEGRTVCINGSGAAPQKQSVERLTAYYGTRMPRYGVDSITVPGAVAGWSELRDLAGSLPWARYFEEAIRFATGGVPVARDLGAFLASERHLFSDPGAAAIFAPGGRPLRVGETLVQLRLGETLTRLASEGASEFYTGRTAALLVDGLRELGSVLSLTDLASHRSEVGDALSRAFDEVVVHTSPPNTQGMMLLRVLDQIRSRSLRNSILSESADEFAALFWEANQLRAARLADPRFEPVDVSGFVDGAAPLDLLPPAPSRRGHGDTVGIAVVDSEGMSVSLIQSVYWAFGSGIVEPRTGILLHNRGSSFSLRRDSPNRIAPGKRPAHTLMPVIVTEGDSLRWVLATQGGQGQPQIHLQLLIRLLRGATADEAVQAPRMIVGAADSPTTPDTVVAERSLDPVALARLGAGRQPLLIVPDHSDLVGQANVVAVAADGELDAAADPRADGSAVVIPRADLPTGGAR